MSTELETYVNLWVGIIDDISNDPTLVTQNKMLRCDRDGLQEAYTALRKAGHAFDEETVELLKQFGFIFETRETLEATCGTLAEANDVEYEKTRRQTAKTLGVRISVLDNMRKAQRKAADRPGGNGKKYNLAADREGQGYIVGQGGAIKENTHNFLIMLDQFKDEWALSYDEFRNSVLSFGEPLDETLITEIIRFAEEHLQLSWRSRSMAMHAIDAGARKNATFDSLAGYLKSLDWDNEPRLDTALADIWGAEQNEVNRLIGRAFFIQMAARGLRPGCKADSVLLLIGKQGIKKSMSVEALCREDRWFKRSSGFDASNKDALMEIQGRWVVEYPEFATFGRSELSAAKAFISRENDYFREPYARMVASHPRRCVFIATTNNETPLDDETGGRRWWPVACGEINLEYLQGARDQLLAEAIAALEKGEPWWIDGEDLQILQGQAYAEDDWMNLVLRHAALLQESPGGFTTVDIMEAMQIDIPKQATAGRGLQTRIGKILKRGGYEKRQIRMSGSGGLRLWRYFSKTLPKI